MITVIAAAALTSGAVHAHGIWFAQRATQLALLYGVGADDLDSVKRQSMFTAINGYDEDGTEVPTKLRVDGPLLRVDSESPPSVVSSVLFTASGARRRMGSG